MFNTPNVRRRVCLAYLVGATSVLASAQPNASLEVVLERLRTYLTAYSQAYAATVATERYTQVHLSQRVTLESEFAMVRVPGGEEWLGFRDVLRVKAVTGSSSCSREFFHRRAAGRPFEPAESHTY